MFVDGDIVRIKEEWLESGEDPNQDYMVLEDYGDGKVKVFCPDEGAAFGGYIFVWPDYMMYKVGHADLTKKS